MEKLFAAIYIRVSTLDQAREGYSLDAQERALRKWCDNHGYDIYDVYADCGISGKDIDHRPEMIRLLQNAREKKFNCVVFWALSRFTRSVSDLYRTLEGFQRNGIGMVSYTESFDTSTPMGRAMIGIVGIFAQLERELTSERVIAAMTERAMQGKRTCSEALGYDIFGKDTMIINDKEAEYVCFCFDEYLRLKNLSKVATLAAAKGYRGKRGAIPNAYLVSKILTNPVYAGYNRFRGSIYKGNHPPIVSVYTFNCVQALLRKRGKMCGRPRAYNLQNLPQDT